MLGLIGLVCFHSPYQQRITRIQYLVMLISWSNQALQREVLPQPWKTSADRLGLSVLVMLLVDMNDHTIQVLVREQRPGGFVILH